MHLETSPAWQSLPRSARRCYAAIATAIAEGNGSDAAVTYLDLESKGVSTAGLSLKLRLLDYVGLVDRRQGTRLASVYSLSTRWQDLSADDVERLSAAAREVKPFGRRRFAERMRPDQKGM